MPIPISSRRRSGRPPRLACAALASALGLCLACATSPLGRRQLQLFPEGQMAEMGATAFQQMQAETPQTGNPEVRAYVECVATAITDELEGEDAAQQWEVAVFEEDVANAFALPGGKMGVYTGLLDVAGNQHQLATVLGHEVAHVLAEHGNERVSTQVATQTGLQIAQVMAGGGPQANMLMAALGVGSQVGVLLPFSRTQETEADMLGLDLMASAGFDPRESIALWENMARAGGAQPPEFLSTHPSHGSRIEELRDRLPEAMELYREARTRGETPNCTPPRG